MTTSPYPADAVAPAVAGDESLVRRYRSGDEGAATDLYLRYARRLRGLARQYCTGGFSGRFDPDDVVQSVFRAFFMGVRRKAYEVPPDGELWGLLLVLTLNKVRDLIGHHRAGKRAVQLTTSMPDPDRVPALAADESAAALLRMVMDEHLAHLPESNRAVVRLRTEGYEVGEIAERTGRSRRTVERVLQSFRDRLTRS